MFFRDVVFGRLPASILESFWLDLDGFGPPSWGHVGSSCVSIGPRIAILGVFWEILAPWTGFELQQEQVLERWRQKMPSWRPPGSILEALQPWFLEGFSPHTLVEVQNQFKIEPKAPPNRCKQASDDDASKKHYFCSNHQTRRPKTEENTPTRKFVDTNNVTAWLWMTWSNLTPEARKNPSAFIEIYKIVQLNIWRLANVCR